MSRVGEGGEWGAVGWGLSAIAIRLPKNPHPGISILQKRHSFFNHCRLLLRNLISGTILGETILFTVYTRYGNLR